MAAQRVPPFGQFGYLITIGDRAGKRLPDAAFQEVSGLGAKVAEIRLKRGVFSDWGLLAAWIKSGRDETPEGRKTVVIQVQRKDGTGALQAWTLRAARPVKYTGPALSATGTDVAIEELVLSCEGISATPPT